MIYRVTLQIAEQEIVSLQLMGHTMQEAIDSIPEQYEKDVIISVTMLDAFADIPFIDDPLISVKLLKMCNDMLDATTDPSAVIDVAEARKLIHKYTTVQGDIIEDDEMFHLH